MALADGANFGPYRITGRLGRGGMATVYRAYEPGLDRYVALKVLPEDSLNNDNAVRRFEREARAVARLVHPNIVPVLAFGIEESTRTPWMALQLIEGGSLASVLAEGPVSHRTALGYLRGIASALDYAHGQNVLHRDVKPHNMLLAPGDHAYLADFGLARMLENAAVLSITGATLGTPQYMAPEQALSGAVDHRCDIYALGVVAYELLSGAPPFQADTPLAVLMKHVREPIPIPAPDVVPEPLLRPVLKALAKEPGDRWDRAGAFVEALDLGLAEARAAQPTGPVALPESLEADASAPPPIVREPPRPRRPPAPARHTLAETPSAITSKHLLQAGLVGCAGLALVLGVGAVLLLMRMREPVAEVAPTATRPAPTLPVATAVAPTTLASPIVSPTTLPPPTIGGSLPVPTASPAAVVPRSSGSASSTIVQKPVPTSAPVPSPTPAAHLPPPTVAEAPSPQPPPTMPSPAPRAATSKLASLTAAATDQNATPASRAQAFLGLAEQGSKAAPALSAIQGALDDESREVRDAATEALIKCCPAEALRHANPRIRQRAVSELALDPQVPGVLEALVQPALTDPDKWVRTSAVNALAKTGPRAAALLGERLTRKDPDYKRALQVLVVIGPQAFKALEDAQKKAQAANDEALAKEIARAIGELSTSRR